MSQTNSLSNTARSGVAEVPSLDLAEISTMTSKSMFGKQPVSQRNSAPQFSFGSSSRNQASNMYTGKKYVKAKYGVDSPGPQVYNSHSSIGSQVSSKNATNPRWNFGSERRFYGRDNNESSAKPGPGQYDLESSLGKQVNSKSKSSPSAPLSSRLASGAAIFAPKAYISPKHMEVNYGQYSPGPAYGQPVSLGKQSSSNKRTLPAWKFGEARRFKYDELSQSARMPGPGAYGQKGAVGEQIVSAKRSLPAFGFGSATRDHSSKVFISRKHEKMQSSKDSPGPSAYNAVSSLGTQPRSTQSSTPSWGFAKANRFKKFNNPAKHVPGPGAYSV
uniref:Flagellar associated protein n=1 Tax=Palpitomonas bilix TaxID=652834 RepID=A0A7S3D5X6_9EUKA|mmetsp:Transcript_23653/g.59582  ORF Transcript_23653/g.59582 Transcript_23653/m.59582 type:complete len:331 (+) Transcript_23653:334-1326(+)|eukprot:CAMPEP_0113881456 /NCGR_PEP_ID=MMETSP0780_2-20120614/8387_1 /TAXON_ID=652834 /ORGANISM="Palpitomonas bilix" /LENGTH=330 /DNA_ID=CAMNT_0000868317 /DNA_START=307 /DNA_END=1302 /DNA_ORIENTATION=- /assembly_acc=CAM_ASM_000599